MLEKKKSLSFLLERSEKVITELSMLAHEIGSKLADKNLSTLRLLRDNPDAEPFLFRTAIRLGSVLDMDYKINKYKKLRQFIRDNLSMVIKLKSSDEMLKGHKDAGGYIQTYPIRKEKGGDVIKYNYEITLNYSNLELKEALIYVLDMHKNEDLSIKRQKTLITYSFNSVLRTILIHELKHAYDSYLSNTLYLTDKKSKEYYKKKADEISGKYERTQEEKDLYWGLPHEYWARFAQAIDEINFKRDFNRVLEDFKWKIRRWDIIDKEGQKRLIKALSIIYLNKQKEFFQYAEAALIEKDRIWESIEKEINRSILYRKLDPDYKSKLTAYLKSKYDRLQKQNVSKGDQ